MTHDVPHGAVLILSDSQTRGRRLCARVAASGLAAVVRALGDDGGDPLAGVADEPFDVVLTDLDGDSPAAVRVLRQLLDERSLPGIPQLHVVHDAVALRRVQEIDGPAAGLTMPADADDALFRTRVTLAAEIGRLRRAVSQSTVRDPLTGAFNRRFLTMRLEQEFARARRYRTPLSIVVFSLDGLRSINERFGQRAGDAALGAMNDLLQTHVRREDTYGRWGAKSFAVLLPGIAHRGAAVFANNVRGDAEGATIATGDGPLPLRASIGIAGFDAGRETRSAAELVRTAEQALVEARRRGGNRVHIDEAAIERGAPLVVALERDAAWLDVLDDLFSVAELTLVRAATAADARRAIRERRPELVLLDTSFVPDDPGLLDSLRDAAPGTHLPVIAIAPTGAGDAAPAGADRFLSRPFSAALLPTVARELIARSRAAGSRLQAV